MITISRLELRDIPEVKQLLSITWADTYGAFLPEETIKKVTGTWHDPKVLEAQAKNPEVFFAVAKELEGRIVGLATASMNADKNVHVQRLYVHPDCQRKGIGNILLKSIIEAFPGCKKIRLEVEEKNNKGVNFYLTHGFEKVEIVQEKVGDVILDAIIMEKLLV